MLVSQTCKRGLGEEPSAVGDFAAQPQTRCARGTARVPCCRPASVAPGSAPPRSCGCGCRSPRRCARTGGEGGGAGWRQQQQQQQQLSSSGWPSVGGGAAGARVRAPAAKFQTHRPSVIVPSIGIEWPSVPFFRMTNRSACRAVVEGAGGGGTSVGGGAWRGGADCIAPTSRRKKTAVHTGAAPHSHRAASTHHWAARCRVHPQRANTCVQVENENKHDDEKIFYRSAVASFLLPYSSEAQRGETRPLHGPPPQAHLLLDARRCRL